MPAIWTNTDDEVERIYNDETDLTDEQLQGAIIVDSIPSPSASNYERATLFYTDTDGLYYEYTDLMGNLPSTISDSDKEALSTAIESSDHQGVCDIICNYL
jgi:hypothetical protein